MSKPWYKSKTVWLGVLSFAAGVQQYLPELQGGFIPEDKYPLVLSAVGVIVIVLRFVTTTALIAKPDVSAE